MIKSCKFAVIALCALGLPLDALGSTVVYVDASATGMNDGSDWGNAYVDLQDALDDTDGRACCAGAGCEVWVAAGTYTPDRGTGQRSATFDLRDCVGIYGGFVGGETRRSARDWSENETILSGDLLGDDIPDLVDGLNCFTVQDVEAPPHCADYDVNQDDIVDRLDYGTTENSYHVTRAIDLGPGVVLDGFTISAGNGGYTYGAGLHVTNAAPTVRNCRFTGNYDGGDGGAIAASAAQLTVVACAFMGNRSGYNRGGAIAAQDRSTLTVIDSTFLGNWGNNGGALYVGLSSATVINSTFFGNHSTWSWGGALSSGTADIHVGNCAFSGNSSNSGGAIQNFNSTMTLANSTLVNNHIGSSNSAGGIPQINGALAIHNSILWGNVDNGGSDETAQVSMSGGAPTVSYSCIQGCAALCAGGPGNTSTNPQLVDALGRDATAGTADDNLRLSAGSSCIDAGDNGAVPLDGTDLDGNGDFDEPIPLDLDRRSRFVDDPDTTDTGSGRAPLVDRGAFEFQDPPPLEWLTSVPPAGAIDARQPSAPDGSAVTGWSEIDLTFNADMASAVIDDFDVLSAGGSPPVINELMVTGSTVRLVLDGPLPAGSCTTVWHTPTAARITFGYLPGDANSDGVAGPLDILVLIDHLNGSLKQPLASWQCDINHSGACEPQDILRLIDLLNGAAEYDAWNGAKLPACPD